MRMLGDDLRYVSRGGLKLEGALKTWGIDVDGLALRGHWSVYRRVYRLHAAAWSGEVLAVDTGYGQMAHKLRVDSARDAAGAHECADAGGRSAGSACEAGRADVFCDGCAALSRRRLVLPAVLAALAPAGDAVAGKRRDAGEAAV